MPRIPDASDARKQAAGQGALFDVWRFHAFFTTGPDTLATIAAGKTHRGHAIIEPGNIDPKSAAAPHRPSGRFTADAPLVLAVITFKLNPSSRYPHRGARASQSHHRRDSPHPDPPGRESGTVNRWVGARSGRASTARHPRVLLRVKGEIMPQHEYAVPDHAHRVVAEWCCGFYITKRRHSSAEMMTPAPVRGRLCAPTGCT